MALRVWLPLNGNLDNLGASNAEAASAGTITVDNNGKIGKCYKIGTAAGSIVLPANIMQKFTTACSIAFWIKINTWNTNYATVFQHGNAGTAWTSYKFGVMRNNDNKLRLAISDGSNNFYATSTDDLTLGVWYHIVFTYTTGKCACYVNGSFVRENTTTVVPNFAGATATRIGAYNASGGYQTDIYLNDFRIYDHCLSALEVKEISQGLILHYKLDRVTNNNMLVNSKRDSGASHTTYNVADFNFNESVIAGEQYTVTAKINTSSEKKAVGFYHSGGSYPMGGWMPISSNGIYIKTFTATSNMASQTGNAGHGYCRVYASNNAGTSQGSTTVTGTANVEWIKVERGTKSSGWSLAPGEGGSHQVIDSSGYGHNGTISALANSQLNSGRYNNGILLDKKKITCSSGFFTTADPVFTISFWFKIFSNITYASYADLVSFEATNSSQLFRLELCGSPSGNNLMWFRGPTGTSGGFNAGPSSSGWCSKDVWHQIALVSNGNKQYTCYFDGVQTSTYDGSANSWTPVGSLGIGDTAEGTAEFADYRIYATAFSAADIMTLYNTSASVDKLGGGHAFEIVENIDNKELMTYGLFTGGYGDHNHLTRPFTNYNDKGEMTFDKTVTNAGSEYFKVNPSGKTYYYDIIVSVSTGNQFYIGFQRYDAAKTARSNNATVYVVATKPTSDVVYQRYKGTVDLSTDGVNPCDTISLRVLNNWTNSTSDTTGLATIHYLSLREVAGTPPTGNVKKNGQFITDEFIERDGIGSLYKNGIGGFTNIIEK